MDDSVASVIDDFCDYLLYERNYSNETIKSYRTDVTEYIIYLQEKSINYLKVKYVDIKDYLTYLNDKENINSTVSRKISSLRAFYKYLVNNNILENNPFLSVKLPKKERKLPRFFSYNELEELFNVPDFSFRTER